MDAAETAAESPAGTVGEGEWRWMERCAALGREAAASGEVAVGSVVTTGDGTWVADGRESVHGSKDVTAHAEVEAIRAACRVRGTLDLSGCILYTTAEPCILCSYAIRETGIARVVIGAWVEDIGGVTSRHPILTDAEMPGWGPPPAIAYAPYPRS